VVKTYSLLKTEATRKLQKTYKTLEITAVSNNQPTGPQSLDTAQVQTESLQLGHVQR